MSVNKSQDLTPYRHDYVDTAAALLALCERLHDSVWIAVDTEFMREKTYFPKLCLLQVASEDVVACVDPLAIADLSPLLEVLYNKNIVKK